MPATVPVVDADAHVNEDPLAWKSLWEKHPGWLGLGQSGGKQVAEIFGKHYPTQEGPGRGVPIESSLHPLAGPGGGDVDIRIKDCDAEGIDVQVLFGGMSIGTTTFDDAGFAADFAEAYNDWLIHEVCGQYPDRLKAVAVVPLQDTGRALPELERAARAGAVALTIPPVLGDKNLDHPSLLPFFEAAAATGLAIGVHSAPGMNVPLPAAGRFDNYAKVHTLSFPVDQMVAFTALAMGGILDRFPTLRVALLESGCGWVPYFVHRMHEHKEKRGDLVPDMRSEPHEFFERGQVFVSFEADEPFLETYVEHLGPDSLVWASDYPHWDCEFPGAVDAARAKAAPLGDDALGKVLGANALRLYGLEAG